MSDLKIFTKNIENEALRQVELISKQPAFEDSKIRIMPDVHAGVGCVIGFTGDLGDKVIPNIVGVDIGCGMLTIELSGKIKDLAAFDTFINENIAAGFSVNKEEDELAKELIAELLCSKEIHSKDRIAMSMGSLGGGKRDCHRTV